LKKYNLSKIHLPLIAFNLLLFITGCAENDGNVGGDIIDPGISGEVVDTLFIPLTLDTCYNRQVNSGQSQHLYVGQSAGFQTKILVRFTNFSALPDSFVLDSATIELSMSGICGDTNMVYPDFIASVKQVLDVIPSDSWSESNVLWDSVLAWSDTSIFDFTISQTPDTDSVVFSIDTAIVNQWISADTSSPNTGLIFDYGLGSQFARQFLSSEVSDSSLKPQLTLYLTPYDSIADSGWVEQTPDTIISYASNDVFICIDTTLLPNDRLYLSRGMARRMIFQFDVSQIFPVFGTYIDKAEYIVFADTASLYNFGTYSTVASTKLSDDAWMTDLNDVNYTASYTDTYCSIAEDSIKLDITTIFRNWVANPSSNYGMVVRFSVEGGELARMPFFSSEYTDPAKIPYLHIIFSRGFEQ
jgi:hypothetical protein